MRRQTDTKFLDICGQTDTKFLNMCGQTDTKFLDICGQTDTKILNKKESKTGPKKKKKDTDRLLGVKLDIYNGTWT